MATPTSAHHPRRRSVLKRSIRADLISPTPTVMASITRISFEGAGVEVE